MNFPFQKTPEIVGGIAVEAGTYSPTWDANSPAPLAIDKDTGLLLMSAQGQPEGVISGMPNPVLVGGTFNNGDNNLKSMAVDSNGTVQVGFPAVPTVAARKIGNPGVSADKASATASTATITYAAGAGSICNYITSVHQSYSGSASLPSAAAAGNLQIKDGSTVLLDIDITAAGANNFYFDPPIQGTAATAMTVVLTSGGTAVAGKINARHYQQ